MAKTAVFTFGRFNPPTIGHYKLIKQVEKLSDRYRSDMFVFPSQSQSSKKDPLEFSEKVKFMKLSFPEYSSSIMSIKSVKTVLQALSWLYDKNYTDVVAVFGSDRVDAFNSLLNQYNGEKGSHGYYDFDTIEIASAGHRDPDTEGVSGMSASKLRLAAWEGDHPTFRKGTSPKLSDKNCHKMYMTIRSRMGLEEVFVVERKLTKAEEKKKEEVVLALKKKYPNWDKSKIYAIATQVAKQKSERVDNNPNRDSKKLKHFKDFVAQVGTDAGRMKAQSYCAWEKVRKF